MSETCYQCGANAVTPIGGVIYTRVLVNGRWQNLAICPSCWNREHPEKPYRVVEDTTIGVTDIVTDAVIAEELRDLLTDTPTLDVDPISPSTDFDFGGGGGFDGGGGGSDF